jgi:hypothetical protein
LPRYPDPFRLVAPIGFASITASLVVPIDALITAWIYIPAIGFAPIAASFFPLLQ